MFSWYTYFLWAFIGAIVYIAYKCWRFYKINTSTLVGTLKIANRERNKIEIRSGIIVILAITRAFIFFEINNQYGSLGNRLIGIVILFSFIPLIYYGTQTLFGGINIGKDVADDIQNFSLYLRSFETDSSSKAKWLEKSICKQFNGFCKLYAIGNPNAIMPPIGAETLYATNASWQDVVLTMMLKAKVILLRIAHSEGSTWELNQCFAHNLQHNTIFIASTAKDFELLKNLLKKNNEYLNDIPAIDTATAVYYNALDQRWQLLRLKRSRDIKQLCNTLKKASFEYASLYRHYKDQRRRLFHHLVSSEQIPESVKKVQFNIGFILNPVMYMFANRWNWSLWILPMACYIAIPLLHYTDHPLVRNMATLIFAFISLHAHKVSWLSRVWPDLKTFNYENNDIKQLMFDYYKAYTMIVIVEMCIIRYYF